jgi:hypothetical protein
MTAEIRTHSNHQSSPRHLAPGLESVVRDQLNTLPSKRWRKRGKEISPFFIYNRKVDRQVHQEPASEDMPRQWSSGSILSPNFFRLLSLPTFREMPCYMPDQSHSPSNDHINIIKWYLPITNFLIIQHFLSPMEHHVLYNIVNSSRSLQSIKVHC